MSTRSFAGPPRRIDSGIPGLDTVLHGGLFASGIYVVVGRPGAGKTILGNQIAFHRARAGRRVAYCTLLTESHGRMLAPLGALRFFDASAVGDAVVYIDGFSAMRDERLRGLLALLRRVVRKQRADLLVLDGMGTATSAAASRLDCKQLIGELRAGVVGCTVLLLTSAGAAGTGKTVFGLHFVRAAAEAGEPALYWGCFEPPESVLAKADRFGFPLSRLAAQGSVCIRWHPPPELSLDVLGRDVLDAAREHGARRLFIDGLAGFRGCAQRDRVPGFFAALMQHLAASGVTAMVSDDLRGPFAHDFAAASGGVTAATDNIILLRRVDTDASLARIVCVLKTRDSAHDRDLYEIELGDGGIRVLGRFDRPRGALPANESAERAAVPTAREQPGAPPQ